MKLSTTPLPANLQDMKLQNIRPLGRSLKKLTGKLLSARPIQVARSDEGGQSAADSIQALIGRTDNKRAKLALNLLLVRPWVLVLGFWLFSMMVGSLALSGMLSPRKLTQALPEPTVVESQQTGNSAINVAKGADELAIDGGASIEADAKADEEAMTAADSSSTGFPVLPLVVLVSSCAAGSLLISRRRAMMRMSAARAKGRVRQGRQILKTKSTHSKPLKVQSLKSQSAPAKVSKGTKAVSPKKRRQRVRRSAATERNNQRSNQRNGQNGQSNRVLASRTNAQQAVQLSSTQQGKPSKSLASKKMKQKVSQKKSLSARAQANRVQAKRASVGTKRRSNRVAMRTASRRQPVVSVVPASERHALDWSQGSLAHQMDVRHQRRAM